MKQNNILKFSCIWLDFSERDYQSKFSKSLTAILNRFEFGLSWDINPKDHIGVKFSSDDITSERVFEVQNRVDAFMARQRDKGVIK